MTDVVFLSVEPSGDDFTVDVIKALKSKNPDMEIAGIGGKALKAVEIDSPIDVSSLSILGFFDALKAYQRVVRLADEVTDWIVGQNPRAVVLVDSWGFTLRVAQRLKSRAPHIKRLKLVGPQVWASRPGRAKTLAKVVDQLFCIHTFEAPFYEGTGLPVTVIGNPALGRVEAGNGGDFRRRYELADASVLLVLPGSRNSEIKRVAPILAETSRYLSENDNNLNVAVLVSPSVREALYQSDISWPENTLFIEDTAQKSDAMAAATLALACSGTVTTELATLSAPMIVGYKVGWLTWAVARFLLFKGQFITLLNVAAGREIVPEFVQTRFSARKLADHAAELLRNEDARQRQISDQTEALIKMGLNDKPAHEITADGILELLQKPPA